MESSNPFVTADTIIAIFGEATRHFRGEFYKWSFDKHPISKQSNGQVWKQELLDTWSSKFNVSPEERIKLDNYLNNIVGDTIFDDEDFN